MSISMAKSTKAATTPTVDLSTKIGGGIVQPALPVIDASPAKAHEIIFNQQQQQYCQDEVPLESTKGTQHREWKVWPFLF